MSETQPERSHLMHWSMLVTILPIAYLLACGPLLAWTKNPSLATGWPDWVYLVCKPIAWLRTNTPLEGPLGSYYDWWTKK